MEWNEARFVGKKNFFRLRIHLLEVYVRSRLLYSVQSWKLSARVYRKLEVTWNSFQAEKTSLMHTSKPGNKLRNKKVKFQNQMIWTGRTFLVMKVRAILLKQQIFPLFARYSTLNILLMSPDLAMTLYKKQILFACKHEKYYRDPGISIKRAIDRGSQWAKNYPYVSVF